MAVGSKGFARGPTDGVSWALYEQTIRRTGGSGDRSGTRDRRGDRQKPGRQRRQSRGDQPHGVQCGQDGRGHQCGAPRCGQSLCGRRGRLSGGAGTGRHHFQGFRQSGHFGQQCGSDARRPEYAYEQRRLGCRRGHQPQGRLQFYPRRAAPHGQAAQRPHHQYQLGERHHGQCGPGELRREQGGVDRSDQNNRS